MKLNKNSWHYKFWIANYGQGSWSWIKNEPNENFCDYFWGLVMAVVLFPVLFVGVVYNLVKKERGKFEKNLIWTLLTTMCTALLIIASVGIYQNPSGLIFIGQLVLGILGIMVVVFGLAYFFGELYPKSNFKKNVSETTSIVKEGWKSFKGKYCPRIEWETDANRNK